MLKYLAQYCRLFTNSVMFVVLLSLSFSRKKSHYLLQKENVNFFPFIYVKNGKDDAVYDVYIQSFAILNCYALFER